MTMPEDFQLIPGRDVSRWPDLKVARGTESLLGLRSRIATWTSAGGVVAVPSLSEDRRRIDFTVQVGLAPPVDIWAMDFGEAIHQLRAALDAVAWDVAHLDQPPSRPTQVQFPVTRSESKFDTLAAGALSSIPEYVLARMKAIQPFNPHDGPSFLALLHALDIADKHKGLLSGKVVFTGLDLHGLAYKDEREQLPDIQAELRSDAVFIEDGANIGFIDVGTVLKAGALREAPLRMMVDFVIEHDGLMLPLGQIVDQFPGLTAAIVRGVLSGLEG